MAKTVEKAGFEESPVKHTPDAEMPDTSFIGQVTRRAKAALPVISNEWSVSSLAISLLSLLTFFGIYKFWRSEH